MLWMRPVLIVRKSHIRLAGGYFFRALVMIFKLPAHCRGQGSIAVAMDEQVKAIGAGGPY